MSSQTKNDILKQNACRCCAGITVFTPAEISNRPGQSSIAYRAGTHSRFLASMLAGLSSGETGEKLRALKTRDGDDFTIALLDAWATVSDVLTFYQERIANEFYLRTAVERLSLLYLARLIGYELRPGVSAAAHLAFRLDQEPGKITIKAGTKVQSVPEQDELPQLFETSEAVTARPKWNEIKPRLTQPQALSTGMTSVTVRGAVNNVKPGDSLLIVAGTNAADRALKRIISIEEDSEKNTTLINLDIVEPQPPDFQFTGLLPALFITTPTLLTGSYISANILKTSWNAANLTAMAAVQKWPIAAIGASIAAQKKLPKLEPNTGIFVFRQRAALFGHNAPKWESLPPNQRFGEVINKPVSNTTTTQATYVAPAYPNDWDSPGRTLENEKPSGSKDIHLDNTYPKIVKNSWLVLESRTASHIYQVAGNFETTRSDFTLSSKVSRLQLDSDDDFNQFKLRETTVLAESEALDLAEIPIPNKVSGDTVVLDGFYDGLEGGMYVILTGERNDLPGVIESEAMTIKEALFQDGFTVLIFEKALANSYVRKTVTISANVAPATHGETRKEVLGSGDGRLKNQTFTLKFNPLTYTSAATTTGSESSLEIRVNDILWHEAPDLYSLGPEDRGYITRLDDDGVTTVIFGDGVNGARLPTGQLNVVATYRQGSGSAANLGAKRLTMLAQRPLGLREVTNPIAASGGADAENRDDARQNAPLTVMTLDRIVSLQDYEDFARAFVGIAKALATWTWSGRLQAVFVTVAGDDGAEVAQGGSTHEALLGAMRAAGDPYVPLEVASYRPAWFQVEGKIKVHDDYIFENVRDEVVDVLRDHFAFESRRFGQPVILSEIMQVIHSVEGVVAADVDALYRSEDDAVLNNRLPTAVPQANRNGATEAAELLLLDPRPMILTEMA